MKSIHPNAFIALIARTQRGYNHIVLINVFSFYIKWSDSLVSDSDSLKAVRISHIRLPTSIILIRLCLGILPRELRNA